MIRHWGEEYKNIRADISLFPQNYMISIPILLTGTVVYGVDT
jgi:hypothetical protein